TGSTGRGWPARPRRARPAPSSAARPLRRWPASPWPPGACAGSGRAARQWRGSRGSSAVARVHRPPPERDSNRGPTIARIRPSPQRYALGSPCGMGAPAITVPALTRASISAAASPAAARTSRECSPTPGERSGPNLGVRLKQARRPGVTYGAPSAPSRSAAGPRRVQPDPAVAGLVVAVEGIRAEVVAAAGRRGRPSRVADDLAGLQVGGGPGLDDLGAEVGQEHADDRPGGAVAEVDYLNAVQDVHDRPPAARVSRCRAGWRTGCAAGRWRPAGSCPRSRSRAGRTPRGRAR